MANNNAYPSNNYEVINNYDQIQQLQSFGPTIDATMFSIVDQVGKSSPPSYQGEDDTPKIQNILNNVAGYIQSQGGDVGQNINLLSNEIENNPSGDLAKALNNLAELEEAGYTGVVDQAVT